MFKPPTLASRLGDTVFDRVITLEDHLIAGGFGAAVVEALAEAVHATRVTNIGVPVHFLPFGSPTDVMESVGMDPDSVVERVLLTVG